MTATQVQLRRGSTVDHATFIGAEGEMTVDTDQWLLVVHDGTTPGGKPAATAVYVDAEILEAATAIDWGRKGADIASASTIDLSTATGDLVDVTGTTTVNAVTLAEGRQRVVRFSGALTLTNGASLVLPGGADILTAAGDFAFFRGYAAGVVCCVSYFAATGLERERAYVDLASAATAAIGGVASRHVRVTGTTGITAFGTAAAGIWRRVRFAAALTLTHNGTSLILPGAANITTAAGDTLTVVSLGSGNWAVTDYQRADGTPVMRASTTEVLTGADPAKPVTADALAALWEKGSNVTAAATISLGEGGYFTITGNTGISDIDWATAKDGRMAVLRFTGTPLITHNATTLMIVGGANWQVAAGDTAIVIQDTSDNVVLIPFRVSGKPMVANVASEITSTASGSLAATNVDAALAELAGEKVRQVVQQVFTGSGTYTPTAGMLYCIVEAIGGGGGGGGCAARTGSGRSCAGSGGGGGYARKLLTAGDIGASKAVGIGAAGTGGTAGNNAGGTGGNTTLGTTLVVASGGSGGGGAAADSNNTGGAGGGGGTGDLLVPGGAGGPGVSGSSGSSGIATQGIPGGSTALGAGGVSTINSTGGAGGNYGGGGGGAIDTAGTNRAGGAGAGGMIIITEFMA